MKSHEYYMELVFELAKEGRGKTYPNPLVGALIVKNQVIIAKGYHKEIGFDHAEVDAIKNSTEDLTDSTMYVNLEPCSHYGRTPPCVNAVIKSGIKNVVIAMLDPNPKVNGNGIKLLKENGINVTVGVLKEEAEKLNEDYIKYIRGLK